MSWFKSKSKKVEENPLPRYHITFWNKGGSIVDKYLDIIPRIGEKVAINDIFKNGECIFYEVIQVYHLLENNMIIVVLDEPP